MKRSKLSANVPGVFKSVKISLSRICDKTVSKWEFCELGTAFFVYVYLLISVLCFLFFQFKVLRGGCWQKVNFKRAGFQLKKAADGSRSLLANPWIQHFRSSCATQVVASADVQKNGASTSQALGLAGNNSYSSCGRATCNSNQIHAYQFHSCHQDLVDDNTGIIIYILVGMNGF